MCQSYCFFLAVFLFCFACWSKSTIKIGFFDDFEMLIFSFFGQKSRVNNLAMVGSITWPYFWPKTCPERWPGYWPYFFHTFFVKALFFFKNLILPAERRGFLKNKKKTQQNTIKNRWPGYWLMMAKLLTLQHIYIYMDGEQDYWTCAWQNAELHRSHCCWDPFSFCKGPLWPCSGPTRAHHEEHWQ